MLPCSNEVRKTVKQKLDKLDKMKPKHISFKNLMPGFFLHSNKNRNTLRNTRENGDSNQFTYSYCSP